MIVIVDYGVGNLGSMANMLKKIGVPSTVSSDPIAIAQADKLILPGVGSFDNGMQNLEDRNLISLLRRRVVEETTPLLGVCLGMQLLGRSSEEGQMPGLGWLEAATIRFGQDVTGASFKIPHMGWNTLSLEQSHPLFQGLGTESRFYFVHSYHMVCDEPSTVLAHTCYGHEFPSVVGKGNIMGVQFHPEKSHAFGMQLLKNFSELA